MRGQEWIGHRSDDVPGGDAPRDIHGPRFRRPALPNAEPPPLATSRSTRPAAADATRSQPRPPPSPPREVLTSQEPAATDGWSAGLTFGIHELVPNVEVIEMDVQALSSQYEFTAGDGRSPQRPSVSFHGDFGAGLRSSDSDAGVRGDFATGMTSAPPLMPPGDFATGLRADPAAERVRGDFGTGQRVNRPGSPGHYGQPTPRAVPVLA